MSRRPSREGPSWGGWVPVPRERRGPWWWLVRHRAEMTVALLTGGLPGGAWLLRHSAVDVLAVGAVVGASLAVPEFRRVVGGQFRRLVVERRMRAAFRESGPCTRSGLVATPFRSASTAAGDVVVWLWCPAGLPIEEIVEARAMLAQACFVDDIAVERHRRWANVAVLTFVRGKLGRRV